MALYGIFISFSSIVPHTRLDVYMSSSNIPLCIGSSGVMVAVRIDLFYSRRTATTRSLSFVTYHLPDISDGILVMT